MRSAISGNVTPVGIAALLLLTVSTSGTALAQSGSRSGLSASDGLAALRGQVRDAATGEPVSFAQVLLEEANRSATGDADGRFEILFVAPGTYTLKVYRIGYEGLTRRIMLTADDTTHVTLRLSASAFTPGSIVVEGARSADEAEGEDIAMDERALREEMGTTVAETLDEMPGIAMRSMGPAPARPVLRGLGGARLLVLEDGGRTGDLSHTSTDHAVVIEPITAERISVIRGPAALAYGPNALAGVVNVDRGYVPSARPDRVTAQVTGQASTVNRGYVTAMAAKAPAGPLAVRVDGSLRQARDLRTPAGVLENTDIHTLNGALGVSHAGARGHGGLAASIYHSTYGIPGGFVGAHPEGVSIAMERRHLEGRAVIRPDIASLRRLETRASLSRYHHREYESNDVLGVEYGVLSYHGQVAAHTAEVGPLQEGAIGLWGEFRDYAAGGFVFTPASTERALAAYIHQKAAIGRSYVAAGLRFDRRTIRPLAPDTSDMLGPISPREFSGLSASVEVGVSPVRSLTMGARLMRSLRIPGISELYSEGPHLAAYTFEVGNPSLKKEKGYGLELFGKYSGSRLSLFGSAHVNHIRDYIFPRNTGERSVRTLLPIYQYSGATARMIGAEAGVEWHVSDGMSAGATLSYVRGTLTERGVPLPEMPPLRGAVSLERTLGPFTVGTSLRAAAPQERVYSFDENVTGGAVTDGAGDAPAAAAETPTDGYIVMDLSAQYYITMGDMLHTFNLGVENALNTTYRDHLSRVRVIMPEPGRNVKLHYKLYF